MNTTDITDQFCECFLSTYIPMYEPQYFFYEIFVLVCRNAHVHFDDQLRTVTLNQLHVFYVQ
jgi:hypothetical protein